MKRLAILTDIHGCYKTLQALLKKLPADAEIVVLGDMIDRGPDSKGVIEWAMSNNIRCCMGNHEHMMLDTWNHEHNNKRSMYQAGIWMYNGGTDCINSFSDGKGGYHIPDKVFRWMARLPTCIIHKEWPNILLSHTGHGMATSIMDAVWCRDWQFPDDGMYRVFGHTQEKEPVITDTYAMIDTGCAYKSRGLGVLTAMVLSKSDDGVRTTEIIQQENIE